MSEPIGIAIIAVGILFDIFGCIGLVRLPDVYNRLQAATKCVTLGTCLILVGAVVMIDSVPGMLKGLLCIAFILLTSPTGAHALARAAHLSGIPLWGGSVVDMYAEDGEPRSSGATMDASELPNRGEAS